MTATQPPSGMIVCPRCKNGRVVDPFAIPHEQSKFIDCDDCNGEGFVPDPAIAIYNGNDPRAIIDLCKPGEDVLRKWARQCESFAAKRAKVLAYPLPGELTYWTATAFTSVDSESDEQLHGVAHTEASAWLRCLMPPPKLKRTCPECNGNGFILSAEDAKRFVKVEGVILGAAKWLLITCSKCNGLGTLPGPEIDPRWLSIDVDGLVRAIRGHWFETTPSNHSHVFSEDGPHYERMPYLADVLRDAGCDCQEMIEHAMTGYHKGNAGERHVDGCWVLEALK